MPYHRIAFDTIVFDDDWMNKIKSQISNLPLLNCENTCYSHQLIESSPCITKHLHLMVTQLQNTKLKCHMVWSWEIRGEVTAAVLRLLSAPQLPSDEYAHLAQQLCGPEWKLHTILSAALCSQNWDHTITHTHTQILCSRALIHECGHISCWGGT